MKPLQVLFAFCFVFLFSSIATYAQQMEDVVYLKDGSIYRGMIIEEVPNQSLKIQIMGGSVIAISINDVSKMTKESVYTTAPNDYPDKGRASQALKQPREKKPFEMRRKGYFFQGQIMAESLQGGMRVVNGYKFGRFGYLGIGVGFDGVVGSPVNPQLNGLGTNDLSGVYLPLYLFYAGDILTKRITPFYTIEAGYAHPANVFGSNVEDFGGGSTYVEGGGAMGGVGLGVRFNTNRRVNFSLLFNANFKNVQYSEYYYLYDEYYGTYDYYESGVLNATLLHWGIRLGIGF